MQTTDSLFLAVVAAALVAMPAGAQPPGAQSRRGNAGLPQSGSAVASGATRYHLLVGGVLPGGAIIPALQQIEAAKPATAEEVRAALKAADIGSGMPNRISMNVSTSKQTQGATFGEKRPAAASAAGGGASAAAYAATGKLAGVREIVVILCDDEQQEREALLLAASQLEASQAGRTKHDTVKNSISNIRRVTGANHRTWSWLSGSVQP